MIFSFFVSAVSTFVSAVSSAISVVGSFAASVGKIVVGAISVVSEVINKVATMFGIIPPNTNMKELGDQALQAAEAGIKPENYDSYQAYINEVKTFKTDPEKSKQWSLTDKLFTATAITAKGIEQKLDLKEGSMGDMATLIALDGGRFFNEDRVAKILTSVNSVDKVTQFFEGTLGLKDKRDMEKVLVAVEQEITPEKTEEEALDLIYDMREALDEKAKSLENNGEA